MKRLLSMLAALLLILAVCPVSQAEETGTATFYLNAGDESIYTTAAFTLGEWVDPPEEPVREGYVFDGWFADAQGENKFSFNARYDSDVAIYAAWRKVFVFEAEYTDLEGRLGQGYSGNTAGTGLIGKDECEAGASNSYYVSCLYYNGAYLTFNIVSDREVSDVTIVLSLSAEFDDFDLIGDECFLDVNGTLYNVEASFQGTYSVTNNGEHLKRPFSLHTVATKVTLNEGENVIEFVVNNDEHMSGATMEAKAPMVDCMYLYTNAELTWEPVLSNLE